MGAIAGIAVGPPCGSSRTAGIYRVDLDDDRTARFISRTAIQRFNGVTDRIEGLIYINTQSLSEDTGGADTELYFEVDLASLDTGFSLRDRHMRNNYLEVEDHPLAAFGGRIVRVNPLPEGGFRVTGQGCFRGPRGRAGSIDRLRRNTRIRLVPGQLWVRGPSIRPRYRDSQERRA